MITFIAGIVGQRAARPVLYILIVVAVLTVMFGIMRLTRSDPVKQQVEQTTASGDAIANAAQDAIGTITNRTVTETDIDRATVEAMENIDNAPDAATVRDAVLDRVCRSTSHRNDPACALR